MKSRLGSSVYLGATIVLLATACWATPTITAVMPNTAHVLGGVTVQIRGSGFVTDGTTQVLFGATPATHVQVVPGGYGTYRVNATVPAQAAGTVEVTVINPDLASSTKTDAFTYLAAPEITSIDPAEGAIAGGNIAQIRGRGFSPAGGLTVTFGEGASIAGQVATDGTRVTVNTPPGTDGAVTVTVANSDASSATTTFTYVPLSASSLSKNSGTQAGKTPINIYGQGFSQDSPTILFGGVPATDVSVSGSSDIFCWTPAHAPGWVDVEIRNPNNDSFVLPAAYEYRPVVLEVTSVTPAAAHTLGGATVQITGRGFQVDGTTQVHFGAVAATNVQVAPAGYSTYRITATVPAQAVGVVDVTVTNPDLMTAALPASFTYLAAPEITSVSPDTGALAGANSVEIEGRGFVLAGDMTVTFGETLATSWSPNAGGTRLSVTSPPGTAGSVPLTIACNDGSSVTTSFLYESISIDAIDPATGPHAGAIPVTIDGHGFTQAGAAVTFGGLPATQVSITGSTRITCTIPAHELGFVDVGVKNPNDDLAVLTQGFEYVPGVRIDSLTPVKGPDAGDRSIRIFARNVEMTGTTQVLFGGVPATEVNVGPLEFDTGRLITCKLPPHEPGTVDITVIAPSGYSASMPAAFTYVPAAPHDNREAPQWIPGQTQSVTYELDAATPSPAGVTSCTSQGQPDLWYVFMPEAAGDLFMWLEYEDAKISVFLGYDGPEVVCDSSDLSVTVQPCQSYLIRIAGDRPSTTANVLRVAFQPGGETTDCNFVQPSKNLNFVEEGEPLVLTAPAGFNHHWKKDGIYMEDTPPGVTGTHTQYLVFRPATVADSGVYTCEYDNGTKTLLETPPYRLTVHAPGSLPALGTLVLIALIAGVALCGGLFMRRGLGRLKAN